jgi:predicted RNase H-like nuclease (RuvC/YqgF family)
MNRNSRTEATILATTLFVYSCAPPHGEKLKSDDPPEAFETSKADALSNENSICDSQSGAAFKYSDMLKKFHCSWCNDLLKKIFRELKQLVSNISARDFPPPGKQWRGIACALVLLLLLLGLMTSRTLRDKANSYVRLQHENQDLKTISDAHSNEIASLAKRLSILESYVLLSTNEYKVAHDSTECHGNDTIFELQNCVEVLSQELAESREEVASLKTSLEQSRKAEGALQSKKADLEATVLDLRNHVQCLSQELVESRLEVMSLNTSLDQCGKTENAWYHDFRL